MGLPYSNPRRTVETSLFLFQDDYGVWQALTAKEKKQEDEKVIGSLLEYKEEKVEFLIPSWRIATKVSLLYSEKNMFGLSSVNSKVMTEVVPRYYWKKGLVDLEFEKDEDGIELIKKEYWDNLVGDEGLSPHVVFAIIRAYNEVCGL